MKSKPLGKISSHEERLQSKADFAENYYALLIAILLNCTAEDALRGAYKGEVVVERDSANRHYTKTIDKNLNRKCNVENCNEKHSARDYCSKHYKRFLRYGDPMIIMPKGKQKKVIV